MNYIVYEPCTGKILRSGKCPDNMIGIQAEFGQSVIEGVANDTTQFIDNTVVIDKSENPATIDKATIHADGVDIVTISTLPNPTIINLSGEKYIVSDGVFSFTVDTPGAYVINCDAFPYLVKEFIVNAS